MKTSTSIVGALALMLACVGASPAHAQTIVGGPGDSNVEVDWSVLDRLGPSPNLAGMLRAPGTGRSGGAVARPGVEVGGLPGAGVVFHPYAPPPAKHKPEPKIKTVSTAPAINDLVNAAQAVKQQPDGAPAKAEVSEPKIIQPKAPEPKIAAAPVEPPPAPKVEPAKPAVPQIALPEVSKPAPPPAPVVAAPPVVAPPVAAKVEPPPTPVAAAPVAPPAPVVQAAPPAPAPVVAAPAPVKAAPQVASLPLSGSAAVVRKGDTLSIGFDGEDAKMPDAARPELDSLAKRLDADESLGLQLLAYASGDEANVSKARRLSLSRALEVRRYLMELGVRSTRIDVRALGNKVEGSGPADRVDAVLTAR